MKRRTMLSLLATLPAATTFAKESGTLVLGQSCALTGPSAQLGIQLNRGARLYFDHVNATGGVEGHKIELRALDDGYEPDRCKANTEKFLDADVGALFGYVGTPTSLAALPLVRESGIPFFGPFTGAMALRKGDRNVFHVRASYDDETALIVNQMNHLGLNKIAVFRQNDSYGQAGLDGVKKALAARHLEPIVVSTFERNSVNVAQAVQEIVSAKPDAVVQIGAYKSCAAFIRGARAAGYGGQYFNVSFVGTKALSDELGPEALGVCVSQVMPYPFSPAIGIVREFLEAVKASGNVQANYSSLEGYIDARVFVEGLRRGRGVGRDNIIGGLESMQHVDFDGFNLNFGARDHTASHFVELSMLTGDGGVRR